MPLQVVLENHVVVITIDNPPLNTLLNADIDQLRDTVDGFASDPKVRVAIITGSGTRSFTAGMDLAEMSFDSSSEPVNPRFARNYIQALRDASVPIIAAVNGYCLGHGIAIATSCDVVLASRNAEFGLPEINIGAGNGQRLMRELFPKGHARHAFFTGEYIPAEEAYRVGAIFGIYAPDQLMDAARTLADLIARKSPLSIRMFKETVKWSDEMDVQTGYRFEGEMTAKLRRSSEGAAEMLEARMAFFEKRAPNYD
jgi:enoyl-CoA hydratase